MSEFGDISRMDLSKLDKKGYHPEDGEDIVDAEEIAEDDISVEETKEGQLAEVEQSDIAVVDAGEADQQQETGKKAHMAAPTGKHYYIDAHITEKEMIAFLFAHNYRSPLMIFATVVGIVWPIYTILHQGANLLFAVVCAGVFLVFMPASIYIRGRNNVRKNPIYENTFHYMVDEAGIHVELAEHAVDVDWSKVTKKMFLKTSVVLYTGKINAYLIPTVAMGDRKEEILRFIKAH